MPIHDVAFYTAGFFILGVLAASIKFSFLIIVTATLLIAVLILLVGYLKKDTGRFLKLAALSLLIIAGSFYYLWHAHYQNQQINIIFDKKINFSGAVSNNPEKGQSQKMIVDLQKPHSGKILVITKPYPSFTYGDSLNLEGIIKKPESSYAAYLAKDGVFGAISFPKIELLAHNQESPIKSFLFNLKNKTLSVFQKILPAEKAAFLSGLTLGERAEFSKEFQNSMNNSGTTHLVALSGYNISIISLVIMSALVYFLKRRWAFVVSIFIILGFVLMTGAEASVVRAAIMGVILLLAKQTSRLYSSRNAITIAAFLMILFNPKILAFDRGFQLSFMALLGIVYLAPALQKLLRLKEESGFLDWRENFLNTLSAQLSVAPLLIIYFNKFSLISLIANLLVLSLIPLTMSLGFITAALGFISYELSLVAGWFISLFLGYEIFIIKIFGKIPVWDIGSLNFIAISIYYLVLIVLIIYYRRFKLNVVSAK